MNKMIIPNEALKYILFQRTAYLRLPKTLIYRGMNKILPFSIYNQIVQIESKLFKARIKALYEDDMRKEYLSIKDFLPETCSSILDIGCGVAGFDVFLDKHFRTKHPKFFLLDKTHVEKSVWYNLESKGAFYNSLDVARLTLVQNNIPEERIHLVEATDNNDIDIDFNIDLIVSLISWGFHYPVETYLEKVYELLKQGGVLILDIRKDNNGVDAINRMFGKSEIILDRTKHQRVLAKKE